MCKKWCDLECIASIIVYFCIIILSLTIRTNTICIKHNTYDLIVVYVRFCVFARHEHSKDGQMSRSGNNNRVMNVSWMLILTSLSPVCRRVIVGMWCEMNDHKTRELPLYVDKRCSLVMKGRHSKQMCYIRSVLHINWIEWENDDYDRCSCLYCVNLNKV